jgi:hypothetical protein
VEVTENQRNAFPSEWELEGKSKDDQLLDNRAAWALQEERHYQWLEDEHNGVKHRRPRRRKKKTAPKE